jgi:hypothetical protein
MRTIRMTGAVAAAALISTLGVVPTARGAKSAAPPAVDPDAISALQKMGEFLRKQQMFSVQSRMTTDDQLKSGQKVQFGGTVDMKVRRPDRLRMDISGDRRNERVYYDGKNFTVFDDRANFFATFAAPATLAELKDVLEKKYAFDLPAADLFYWGTANDMTASITHATRVGAANIEGFVCDHYAFRQKDVDWEVWIEQGGRPLPRKMVITTTSEPSKPQHSMVMNWDLNAKFADDLFTFVPPATAHQIDFDVDRRAASSK